MALRSRRLRNALAGCHCHFPRRGSAHAPNGEVGHPFRLRRPGRKLVQRRGPAPLVPAHRYRAVRSARMPRGTHRMNHQFLNTRFSRPTHTSIQRSYPPALFVGEVETYRQGFARLCSP